MRNSGGGYTIFEVMIFLTVSVVLFATILIVLGGQTGHTQFSQSMRDIQSKMQDWVNDVSTGFGGGGQDPLARYTCSVIGSKPTLAVRAPGAEVKPTCIFLGKAIQFTDTSNSTQNMDPSKIYVYTVIGQRVGSDGSLVSSLAEANPAAAAPDTGTYPAGSPPVNLTEQYILRGGAKVLSIKSINSDSTNTTSHLAGFYLSFNSPTSVDDSSTGVSTINSFQYKLPSSSPASQVVAGMPLYTDVLDCIRMDNSCPPPPVSMGQWKICFGNENNQDKAVLTISSFQGFGAHADLRILGSVASCPA